MTQEIIIFLDYDYGWCLAKENPVQIALITYEQFPSMRGMYSVHRTELDRFFIQIFEERDKVFPLVYLNSEPMNVQGETGWLWNGEKYAQFDIDDWLEGDFC
jgi:hypothetical protein